MALALVFLASNRGSSARAVQQAVENKKLKGVIKKILTNKPNAPVLDFAKEKSIPAEAFSNEKELATCLLEAKPNLVFLSGYLKKIPADLLDELAKRAIPVLNIHPSLLPKFGGKGMFGANVHQAVLEAKEKETGATLHLVNSNYDEGKIIAQTTVAVEKTDTPESLAARVMKAEESLVVETLSAIAKLHHEGLSVLKAIEKISS